MSVTPANQSITPPAPGVQTKDPFAHNLDSNVYAAQAPQPNARENPVHAQVTPPAPLPRAQRDIDTKSAHDESEKRKDKADADKEGKREENHKEEAKRAPAGPPPVTDTLAFAIIDLQRGINQLRSNSAATVPGTWVHEGIRYFERAIERLDHSLGQQRMGAKITAEQRAAEMARYEHDYRDLTPAVASRVQANPPAQVDHVNRKV
jgi:hypothetical protein